MATRTWSGTTSNDWNIMTNWVEGFIPTNADDVVFSTNVDCTISSASVCKTIDFGSYSGTFTNTGGLTVSGDVTLGSSVIWGTFTSALIINTTATLTSNGKDIPYLRFLNTITITFADDWTVTSNLFFPNVSMTLTLNGNTLYVSGGNITHHNACTVNGTTTIEISGTVNYSNTGANYISNPIIINTAGTFSLSNAFNISNTTITWLAGTFDPGTSTTTTSGTITFTGTGLTFNNLTALTNTTLTLSNNITITGNLSGGGSTATFVINGFTLYIGGGLNTVVNTIVSGTTNIVLNGTGTIQNTSSTGNFRNNIEINTSGTITFGTNFRYGVGIFKWTAGATNTTGSTFNVVAGCTIDVNGAIDGNGNPISTTGVNFWNFTNSASAATLTTPLCVINLLTFGVASFSGANVYCQGSFTTNNNTGGGDITLNGSGVIYTGGMIRSNFTINTNGKYTIANNVLRFNSATFTYIKGIVNTRNVVFYVQAVSTLIGMHKLRFKQVRLTNTITMDEFFQGSASQICEVLCDVATNTFAITFTDGFQKISNYTSVQGLVLTNTATSRGSLLLTYSKANRGRNIGNITYVNDKPNGIIDYQDTVKSLESMAGVQLQGDPAYN